MTEQERQMILQEPWLGDHSTQRAMQLLYTILRSTIPTELNAPLQIGTFPGIAPIQFGDYTGGSPVFSFTGSNGQPQGTVSYDPNTGQFNHTSPSGTTTPMGGGGSGSGSNTSIFKGVIESGSEETYSVTIYPNGLSGSTSTVSVTQINPIFDLPAGTPVLVIKGADGSYFMNAIPANLCVPGTVVSGSGTTYQVDIYPNGMTGASKRVTCKQLKLTSGTIPSGTPALVTRTLDGTYEMQVPIWLTSA